MVYCVSLGHAHHISWRIEWKWDKTVITRPTGRYSIYSPLSDRISLRLRLREIQRSLSGEYTTVSPCWPCDNCFIPLLFDFSSAANIWANYETSQWRGLRGRGLGENQLGIKSVLSHFHLTFHLLPTFDQITRPARGVAWGAWLGVWLVIKYRAPNSEWIQIIGII